MSLYFNDRFFFSDFSWALHHKPSELGRHGRSPFVKEIKGMCTKIVCIMLFSKIWNVLAWLLMEYIME